MSAYTSLVIPTLAYYVGALAAGRDGVELWTVIDSGQLSEALYLCAVLTRLLNDVGYGLLAGSTKTLFEDRLVPAYAGCESLTITDLVVDAAGRFGRLFARLEKDARLGEFNLCLYNFPTSGDARSTLSTLEQRLSQLSTLYREGCQRLERVLESIDLKLGGDTGVSGLIRNCYKFHEALYSHSYQRGEGEYAH
jgi:hypothetical protein